VPEYWYVDIQADRIEVHRLEGGRYAVPRIVRRGEVLSSPEVPASSSPSTNSGPTRRRLSRPSAAEGVFSARE
jgi:hypothetical protein